MGHQKCFSSGPLSGSVGLYWAKTSSQGNVNHKSMRRGPDGYDFRGCNLNLDKRSSSLGSVKIFNGSEPHNNHANQMGRLKRQRRGIVPEQSHGVLVLLLLRVMVKEYSH